MSCWPASASLCILVHTATDHLLVEGFPCLFQLSKPALAVQSLELPQGVATLADLALDFDPYAVVQRLSQISST